MNETRDQPHNNKILSLSDEAHNHALKPIDDETPRFTANFDLNIL